MPADVAARLDDVLAGLVAERRTPTRPRATVVTSPPGAGDRRQGAGRRGRRVVVGRPASPGPAATDGRQRRRRGGRRPGRGRRRRRAPTRGGGAAAATPSPSGARERLPSRRQRCRRGRPDPLRRASAPDVRQARGICNAAVRASAVLEYARATTALTADVGAGDAWSRRRCDGAPAALVLRPLRATSRSSTSTCATTPSRAARSCSPRPDGARHAGRHHSCGLC